MANAVLVLPRLSECEGIIERGLSTFVEVGNALLEIRDSRLYRESHATSEAYCRKRWGMARQRAHQLIGAAEAVSSLSKLFDKPPTTESHAAALAAIEPPLRASVWERALETAPEGKITAAHVRETAREFVRTETPVPQHFRTQFTGENEWYTPPDYVEAARRVLGCIDLDPASSEKAQKTIRATRFFSAEDDGLTQDWGGRVWLNPPYAQPLIQQFAEKVVAEVRAGRISEAIVLTHNYTDTAWFHLLESACAAICFTRGRIRFVSSSGELASPTQGQAFFYFGQRREAFAEVFRAFGFVR